jgi:hypothetical protein
VKAATVRDPHARDRRCASDCILLFRSQPAEWRELQFNPRARYPPSGFDCISTFTAVLNGGHFGNEVPFRFGRDMPAGRHAAPLSRRAQASRRADRGHACGRRMRRAAASSSATASLTVEGENHRSAVRRSMRLRSRATARPATRFVGQHQSAGRPGAAIDFAGHVDAWRARTPTLGQAAHRSSLRNL